LDTNKTSKLFSAAGVDSSNETLHEGFLSEYWSSKEPLPKLSSFGALTYYLKLGMQTALSVPASSVITILTMAVSLFLFAGFILLLQNVSSVIEAAGSSLFASAYFTEQASQTEINVLVSELNSNPRVSNVKFISKDQALREFRRELGDKSGFLEGLDEDNPLPRSLDLVFRADALTAAEPGNGLDSAINELRENPIIEELVFGSEWVDRVRDILGAFNFFGLLGVIVMLGIVVFLISNTIKLVIYSRRDEISIMQLVGASDVFIKVPFVLGGVFQGLVGSLLGLTLLKLAFVALNFELKNSQVLGVAVTEFSFLPVWMVFVVVILGIFVGAFGSLMSLGKFLNV
jgi:cell division transport system permease protein